jgi:hypothetical protein
MLYQHVKLEPRIFFGYHKDAGCHVYSLEVDMENNVSLSDVQAAAFLGLRPQTLRNWRHFGKGPKYSRPGGRRVVYRIRDLEEFLAKSQIDPEARREGK